MLDHIATHGGSALEDYAAVAHLSAAVHELLAEASVEVPKLAGRTVWMVNSTAVGGGVAEMLPRMVELLNELGVHTRWVVIGTDRQDFFPLTKRLHNLIHGAGDARISKQESELYETVSSELASEFAPLLASNDILVIHDPQPAGMGAKLRQQCEVSAVWRCHIGLDQDVPQTEAAWKFLRSYVDVFDHCIFSAPEYIPKYLSSSVSIIHPSLDPHSHKNRELSIHKLVGILHDAQLLPAYGPLLTPPFDQPALRLHPDGQFRVATLPDDIGLLTRPIVSQISRWDKLKGWRPLLEGFVRLKSTLSQRFQRHSGRELRELELARLVLAGPEPAAVSDDPEAQEVFDELCNIYCGLSPELQSDVVILSLPMASRKNNALMVNALQRCSTLVVQNSLREGFGLTVAEAMWKRTAVIGSSACGLRQQIRHGIDGHLWDDPEDVTNIADVLEELLTQAHLRENYARTAQRRVHDDFLIFTQLRRWLRVLAGVVDPRRRSARPGPGS